MLKVLKLILTSLPLAYPGLDQFYGDPEDSIRSLNLDNFREEYFVSGLPAFDRQLLEGNHEFIYATEGSIDCSIERFLPC